MGYHRHHAIVVTSWQRESAEAAHAEAKRVFADTPVRVTPLTEVAVNGYSSFLVAPDGSKEGWVDSDRADAAREQFVAWLRDTEHHAEWVEVEFGGDDPDMLAARGPYGRIQGRADDGAA